MGPLQKRHCKNWPLDTMGGPTEKACRALCSPVAIRQHSGNTGRAASGEVSVALWRRMLVSLFHKPSPTHQPRSSG